MSSSCLYFLSSPRHQSNSTGGGPPPRAEGAWGRGGQHAQPRGDQLHVSGGHMDGKRAEFQDCAPGLLARTRLFSVSEQLVLHQF